jgi:hypothetical protein
MKASLTLTENKFLDVHHRAYNNYGRIKESGWLKGPKLYISEKPRS